MSTPHKNQLQNDEAAQVGIGTMIVFIATILIAAVAAGVLIDTSQSLSDKSTRTGNEATGAVGTTLQVSNVWGLRCIDVGDGTGAATPNGACDDVQEPGLGDDIDKDDAGGDVVELWVDVELNFGADNVDLDDLLIQYTDGQQRLSFSAETGLDDRDSTSGDGRTFFIEILRDEDNSLDNDDSGDVFDGVMNEDDRVRIIFGATVTPGQVAANAVLDEDLSLSESSRVAVNFAFGTGSPINTGFTSPVNYGQDDLIPLL